MMCAAKSELLLALARFNSDWEKFQLAVPHNLRFQLLGMAKKGGGMPKAQRGSNKNARRVLELTQTATGEL